jgi:hypothetical protein
MFDAHPVPRVTLPRLPSLAPDVIPSAPAVPVAPFSIPARLAHQFADRCAARGVSPGRLLAVCMRRWMESNPVIGASDNPRLVTEQPEHEHRVSAWLSGEAYRRLVAAARDPSISGVIEGLIMHHLPGARNKRKEATPCPI